MLPVVSMRMASVERGFSSSKPAYCSSVKLFRNSAKYALDAFSAN